MLRLQVIRLQVLLVLLLTIFGTLLAQETGSITGQILDPAGAIISRAKVEVKSEATAAVFSTLSDDTGFYRAPQLRPGVYTITASIAGFRTSVRPGVEVRVNDRLRVDLQLEVGAVTESLTVQGQAALLQTEDATAGQVIDTKKIVDLPLNSRNWLQLATLAAGTVSYPGSVDTSAGNSQNVVMNVGGTHTNQGNWLLDGTDNTNFVSAGAVAYPPVDSLQEFKVETNNYSADTGRLGGAVINATIRSGSNGFHGTAYDFLRNRELNARNFFANPTANKPEFTRNQYGASLGGPFVKDKLLFFLNYEGNRQRQDQIVTRQVFTDAQKAGNFSSQLGAQIGVDALGRPVLQGEIFDPFSVSRAPNGAAVRDPFPGNIIPANRINPVASALINLVPGPNTSGNPNLIRDLSNPLNIDTFAGRVDWLRSAKNSVFGHFIYSDQNSSTAPALGLPIDGGGFTLLSNQRQLATGWTHVFSPTSLNDFRIGYLRNHRLTQELQANQDLNAKYGIPFPYPGDGVGGLATIAITGYTSLGSNGGTFPQFVNKYELSDGYTLIRGRHSMKFGFQGEVKTFENRQACNSCRGALTFNGLYTQQPGFAATGSAVADFLTGVANDSTLANVRSEKDVGKDYDFYAQDKWLVTPKVTVSLGLRYQLHPPMFEAHDALSNVLFGPQTGSGQLVVPEGMNDTTFNFLKNTLMPYIPVSKTSDLGNGLVRTNYKNFAPRMGIAWQITPKTVLRTGYGIFYGFPDQTSSAVLSISPPGNLSITTSSNQIDPTLLINQSIFGANPFNRPLTNPSFFAIFDPDMHAEVIQMYNLSVQHQFGSSWVAEVGYMGNRGSHLLFFNNVNDAFPAIPSDTSTPQSRRRVSTVLGNLSYYAPQGYSNYNAMTLSIEKRYTQGFTLLGSYTWSRALGLDPASILGVNSTAIVNPFNLKQEYGPLEFDVIKRGVFSYTYELPLGKGKRYLSSASKALDQIVGGWQLSGITILQGGLPITPVLGVSLGKTFTNSRPDVVGDPTASARQPYNWLNKSAFAIPTSSQIAAGDFYGNAGRGSVRAPGLVNFDFSVMKNFQVGERRRLQFRGEFFNVMNTPFFGGDGYVNVNVSSPTFGQITQAGDPRVIQLGLKFIF